MVAANLNDSDDAGAGEQDVLLAAALDKARKLVAELERQQRELAESPSHHADLSPQQLAEGKQAFASAVASARRMLKALEDAAAIPADER